MFPKRMKKERKTPPRTPKIRNGLALHDKITDWDITNTTVQFLYYMGFDVRKPVFGFRSMMMMSWSLTTHQPFWVISVINVR